MRRFDPWGVLIVFALALSAVQVASQVTRVSMSVEANDLASFSWSFLVIYWIVRDARRRRRIPCHEFGFLVAAYLPLSVIWYVFWTRGWRGFLTLAGILGLILLPWFFALLAWLLLQGFP